MNYSETTPGFELMRPNRLSPAAFKAAITAKGWRMADAACRWGIKPETLSRLAANPMRDAKWDDLARALPRLTRAERAAATAVRQRLSPSPKRARNRQPQQPGQLPADRLADINAEFSAGPRGSGLRYQGYVSANDELVVVEDYGSFAKEGECIYVNATRLGSDDTGGVIEEYEVEFASGKTTWLTPDDMDRWMVPSGRTRDT